MASDQTKRPPNRHSKQTSNSDSSRVSASNADPLVNWMKDQFSQGSVKPGGKFKLGPAK
jgi:hypothetical protein